MDETNIRNIIIDVKKILNELEFKYRIEKAQQSQSFNTVKDHKGYFSYKTSCQLQGRIQDYFEGAAKFFRKTDHRNDIIYRKLIDSAKSKKLQF